MVIVISWRTQDLKGKVTYDRRSSEQRDITEMSSWYTTSSYRLIKSFMNSVKKGTKLQYIWQRQVYTKHMLTLWTLIKHVPSVTVKLRSHQSKTSQTVTSEVCTESWTPNVNSKSRKPFITRTQQVVLQIISNKSLSFLLVKLAAKVQLERNGVLGRWYFI